jgi:hypothetical protein
MNRNQLGGGSQSVQQPADFLTQKNFIALMNWTSKTLAERHAERHPKLDPVATEKRLANVVNHYMKEVGKLNTGKKVPDLNRDVWLNTLASMESWINRGGENTGANADTQRRPEADRLYSNVGTQMAALQQERGLNQNAAPTATPNFRAMVEEDEIDPMALFAKAKEQREKEGMAKKPENGLQEKDGMSSKKPEIVLRDDSPEYKIPQVLSQDIIIRQPDVMKYKEVEYNIFVNSSDRDWINNFNENRYNFTVNFNRPASADEPSFTPSVQQRFKNVQRVETVKVIMSLESLPIKSNTGINQSGSHEIDTIVQVAAGPVYASNPSVSAYAYQYIAMRIAELNTNGFGTNTRLDNSFAILHKDTDWVSDSTAASANKGYASMSPKYLKCQKIYSPTLGSLDRLSIRLERPDGQLLSDTSDVLTIQQFVLSGNLDAFTTGLNTTLYKGPPATVGQLNTTPASATQTQNEYIFIQTTGYFSKWQINFPDRIIIKNAAVSGTQTGAVTDFLKFVNREEGHAVVGLAYNSAHAVVADGQNTNGFANWIIIRSEFNDPQLSSSYFYSGGAQYLSRNYFGNTAANELTFGQTLYNASSSQVTLNSGAALINMNHQTHVVLRVVCREMDGSSSIRPDNI